MDNRIEKLSDILVNYSCEVKPGDNVWLEYSGTDPEPLVRQLIKDIYKAGGCPFVRSSSGRVKREFLLGCTEEQLRIMAKADAGLMAQMQCYIGIGGGNNIMETSDVPAEKMQMYSKIYGNPVHNEIRVPKTRWVVLRYPNGSMAQSASMSTEAFEDFYFDVCTVDYKKMGEAMQPLKELMEKTDKVRITGPGTDLTFSIKDIPAIPCDGKFNIPDGEVFTAPVKDSVNGVITYNAPSVYQGTRFENICLRFENGRIVEATSNNTQKINDIFDTDEGSRYVGEFAIGVNPYVVDPMLDILFDEKIKGSFHFTPGCCYEDEAPNGNISAIHWDLVCIQTPERGGGEIWFDDVLVRKDGLFVLPELEVLNPDNLK